MEIKKKYRMRLNCLLINITKNYCLTIVGKKSIIKLRLLYLSLKVTILVVLLVVGKRKNGFICY